ncbi:MAG: hypothetical protein JST73_10375 [Actinobacteria bacterium]|nr:hypothetical protein [Actinomycetota bacterium]
MTRIGVVAGALALVPLAGCSSSGSGAKKANKTATTVVAKSGNSTGNGNGDTFTNVQNPQGSVKGFVGAFKDATVTTCKSDNGVLQVAGTVKNPESDAQQYRIYVTAMANGNVTRGVSEVNIDPVPGHESKDWQTMMPLKDPNLTCLLRVERFAPQH